MPQILLIGEWVVWIGWLTALLAVVGWVAQCSNAGQSSRPQRWGLKHPRAVKFMADRTSWNAITGLPLTMLVLVCGYFLIIYATGILVAETPGAIVRLDGRVANWLATIRTPWLVDFFSLVTAFGYWAVVLTLAVAVTILLWLQGRSNWVVGLWIALVGNQVMVTLIKALFRRARPDLAFFKETSYSFPSGHAALSAAFVSLLVYAVIRYRILPSGLSVLGGSLAILLVGISRLVLSEHFLSDVVSGYLVGFYWAFIGIWWVDRLAPLQTNPQSTGRRQAAQVAVVIVTAVALWLVITNYQHTRVVLRPAVAASLTVP